MLDAWSGDGRNGIDAADADAEDHHARPDQHLQQHRDADGVAHRGDVAHRVVAGHLVGRGGDAEPERHPEGEQIPASVNHQPVIRGSIEPDVLAERRDAAGVRQHHRHGAHQRQHHDQRLDELDVGAGAHAAERGVEAGAGQQRRHRHQRADAEDRRRDLADRLELRREQDRVADDDEGGGEGAGAFAGKARPDVVGHGERAEAPQLRRDEHRRQQPPGPHAEPDPHPAHAGEVVAAERADESAGADLRGGQHRAAHPRADGAPGGQEVFFAGGAAIAPYRHAEHERQVGDAPRRAAPTESTLIARPDRGRGRAA